MGLFNLRKKEISKIENIKHLQSGPWHQYDVILKTCPFGWEQIVDYVDCLIDRDLINISSLTVSDVSNGSVEELIEIFNSSGRKLREISEIQEENGTLSIAGESVSCKAPIKIVWINQTNIVRIFTLVSDELIIKKYIESFL